MDSTIDAVSDIYEAVAKCYFSGNDLDKSKSLEVLVWEKLPRFMTQMNRRLKNKRYIVGQEMTIADFALGGFFLQTVVNESSPHNEYFLAELERHENCIAFVKHFHSDNLSYIENMTSSFF